MRQSPRLRIEVVDDAVAEILRKKTPAERIAIASAAHGTARLLIEAQVRRQHTDWEPEQIREETIRRMTRGAN
jgi:hypothetical protein